MPADPAWLTSVRQQLANTSVATVELVTLLAPAIGEDAVHWIDDEPTTITIYLATPACVHIVQTSPDTPPDEGQESYPSSAEHRTVRITRESRFTTSVGATARRSSTPGSPNRPASVERSTRLWSFILADETISISTEIEIGREPKNDATAFACELARFVLEADRLRGG